MGKSLVRANAWILGSKGPERGFDDVKKDDVELGELGEKGPTTLPREGPLILSFALDEAGGE
jgi:hypothetical protein